MGYCEFGEMSAVVCNQMLLPWRIQCHSLVPHIMSCMQNSITLRNTHIKNPSAYGCAPEAAAEFSASKMCWSPAAYSIPLPRLRYKSKNWNVWNMYLLIGQGWEYFERKQILSQTQFKKHVIESLLVKTNQCFGINPKAIYTQETYAQRSGSNSATGNKRRALAFWFSVQICN